MGILDTLNKNKGLQNETTNTAKPTATPQPSNSLKQSILNKRPVETPTVKPTPTVSGTPDKPKLKPFKLGIGVAKTKPISPDEKQPVTIHNEINPASPLAELASVVQSNSVLSDNSISSILGDMSNELAPTPENLDATTPPNQTLQGQVKSSSNTLDDLSKFVFEEQPDESTEEIAFKFSTMLDGLGTAVGSDIPSVLSDTLKFMKEHAFLAEILKPAEIGKLVQTMAKSYGYVANNQTQKSTKRKVKVKEQNDILNSLDMLKF